MSVVGTASTRAASFASRIGARQPPMYDDVPAPVRMMRASGLLDWRAVLARCLAKHPMDRYRDGGALLRALDDLPEIASWGPGQPRLALYTGVLALFRSPS